MPYSPQAWKEGRKQTFVNLSRLWTSERIALIAECIRARMSVKDTAKKLNCTIDAVEWVRSRYLPDLHFHSERIRKRCECVDAVRAMRAKGMSYSEIGQKIGRTRCAVAGICARHGIRTGRTTRQPKSS